MKAGEMFRAARRWFPIAILVLAALNIARLWFFSDLEVSLKFMKSVLTLFACVVLLAIWLLGFSGWRWRTRFATLGGFVLVVFGLSSLLRMDGTVNGSGIFRVAWKWSPRKNAHIGDLTIVNNPASRTAARAISEFPSFLGPERDGVIKNVRLDSDWGGHSPKLLWRQPIGLGWSSFAVSGSSGITQEQRGENEMVVCYELETGHARWIHTNKVRFAESLGGDGPRATPTIAGGRVYALGATGILDCLDANTGRSIWSRDTLKENGLPNLIWGKSSSPLVVDDLVVVTGGATNGPTLLAYRSDSGAPAWRSGTAKASYSSPMLVTLCGKRQILIVNAASVSGHDPSDGHLYWEYAWPTDAWPKCAQPVVIGNDRIFLSASYGAGCVLLQLSAGPDGKLVATERWKNHLMKSAFSNVVPRDEFIYGLDDGVLACVDVSTGQRKWKDGRYGHGQVLLVGDLLLVQTERGPVTLVQSNPGEFHELARLDALDGKTWTVPALAGDLLLVRNDQEAACYRLPLHAPVHYPARPQPK
jgi:outer membrane protein assembly factor BamB